MKKILTSLASIVALSSIANADMARVELGGGVWNQAPSGTMSYSNSNVAALGLTATGVYTSNENDSSDMYVWMLIKHPIPVVPNIRLEYTSITDDGEITGKFENFDTEGVSTHASLDMTQYDIIPYYNILDNTMWTTLDLGIDIKIHETKSDVAPLASFEGYKGDDTIVIPLVYARVRVEIPGTGIGLEGDGKYITYDGSTIYDFRAKVDYTLDLDMVIDPGIEVGYRVQKFDIDYEDGSDHTIINMDYTGVYAGLMLRF
jgi:outer membrane protein